jgi:acetyltransferase
MATDTTFGPVILFGHGGTAVEIVSDKAVALPPLNLMLARELIARTRIARLFDGYRDRPGIDRAALELTLVKLSHLVCDVPEIVELDINPLLADSRGVCALDARARIARVAAPALERLAIRPYPDELEETVVLDGRRILLRPIRPEDEPQHRELLRRVSPEDLQLRFFHARYQFSATELARFTQIDYDREMAFIAACENQTLGVARAIADPDGTIAEFAVLVRSDFKRRGLGRALLEKIVAYCRDRGIRELFGDVLAENKPMLALAGSGGFEIVGSRDDPRVIRVRRALRP